MEKPTFEKKIRILIADDETLISDRLANFLREKRFDVKTARNGTDAMKILAQWVPHFIIYDMMLPDLNALAFLKRAKAEGIIGSVSKARVIVTSGHNNPQNVRECLRMGASDYLPKPVSVEDVLARLILQLHPKHEIKDFRADTPADYESAQYYIYLIDLILREALKGTPSDECLHNLTGMLSLSLKAVRVSVVRCQREAKKGTVFASSDKKNISALNIDLVKYPEIMYTITNEKPLAIDNLTNDPTMHFVTRIEKSIRFNAMIVCPIRIQNRTWGVLSARLSDSRKNLNDFEIRYTQLAAHVVGLVVQQSPALLGQLLDSEAA